MSDDGGDRTIVVRGWASGAAATVRFERGKLTWSVHGMVSTTEREFAVTEVQHLATVRPAFGNSQRLALLAGAAVMGLVTKSVVASAAVFGIGVASELLRRLFRRTWLRLVSTDGLTLELRVAADSRASVASLLHAVGRQALPAARLAKSPRLGSGGPDSR